MGNELVSSILSYALSVFMGAAVVAASVPLVHILQLESYQGRMYLKWLMKHIGSDFVPSFVAGAAALALRAGYVLIGGTNPLIGRICYYLADIVYIAMLSVIYLLKLITFSKLVSPRESASITASHRELNVILGMNSKIETNAIAAK